MTPSARLPRNSAAKYCPARICVTPVRLQAGPSIQRLVHGIM